MVEAVASLLIYTMYALFSNILVGVAFVWAVAERDVPVRVKLDSAKKAVCLIFLLLSCLNFLTSLVLLGAEVCRILQ